MDKNDSRYKRYTMTKECLEKYSDYYCKILTGNGEVKKLTRKQTEAYVHCLGCKAEKTNNFERYCSLCSDYWRNYM